MRLWSLGSGSSGNAVLIECDDSRILIDCGFGVRELARRLKSIGVAPQSITACFITHEHGDHVRGAAAAARRWQWTIHATHGTARARELSKTLVAAFHPGAEIALPRMTVSSIATPHDASQSVGFVVTSRDTGARAGLFYDFGYPSRAILDACKSLDILVLESNHDADMLRNGPYPIWLQRRIAGKTGHLSNHDAARFARYAATRQINHIVLAHLSENCNTPAVALDSMRRALARTVFRGTITAAKQDDVVGPFSPRCDRAGDPVQYSLFA
ncbi:MAG TPA: MBL fold metallo-hydrolase [Gemmatimonadaceae bacterium]|nr:MBL fold metallo-hydrolase [Gemmatimonadaceae bacterium]